MYCSVCGTQLPTGGVVCPNCGASVSSLPSAAPGLSTASPDDPTFVASSNPYHTPSTPSTGSSSNPYEAVPPPPPTAGFKSGRRRGIIIGAIVGLVILVVLAGLLVTLRFYPHTPGTTQTHTSGTAQAQTTPGPNQIAATATAMASRNPYPPLHGNAGVERPATG